MARRKTQSIPSNGAVDLTAFDDSVQRQEEGIEVDIKDFDGKTPIGLKIRVAGPDSSRANRAMEEQIDEITARAHESGGKVEVSARERNDRAIRFLARVTISWTPSIKLGGEELEYSVDNAIKLYTRLPFIRDQVDRVSGKRSSFMKG